MIIGDYSSLGLLIADNTNIKAQLNKLSEQVSTGHVADSYGGLGAAAQVSLDLRPQLNHLATEQGVIGAATARLGVTQSALSQLASITSSFAAQTVNLNGVDANAVDSVAAAARTALQQVAVLLDSTDGGLYLFAGTDSSNPPVPGPDQILASGFYGKINAAVAGLSPTGDNSAAVTAGTLALAQSNAVGTTPFSATLGPAATVQVGGQLVQVGLLANANTLAVSVGGSTTGSYARDLLRSLATLGSLSSAQLHDPGFQAVVADTRASLQGAVTALADETGALGDVQANLLARATEAQATSLALTKQVSAVEDVDMAKALTQLSQAQLQLQASYKIIATAKNLSLVQYL